MLQVRIVLFSILEKKKWLNKFPGRSKALDKIEEKNIKGKKTLQLLLSSQSDWYSQT